MADNAQDAASIEQAKELTAEEEENLAAFLQKVQKACADDKSVPDFVGLQVNQWMQELNDKRVTGCESKSESDLPVTSGEKVQDAK